MTEETPDTVAPNPEDNAGEGNETPPVKEKVEEKEAPPEKPPEEPPKESEKSQIDIAKELVAEMQKQNQIMADNIKQAQKVSAEQLLGGHIPAGREQTKEDIEIAAAKALIKGTGFEEQLFPEKKDGD